MVTAPVKPPSASGLRSAFALVASVLGLTAVYVALILFPSGQQLDSSFFGPSAMPAQFVHFVNLYRVDVPVALMMACGGFGVFALVRKRFVGVVRALAIGGLSVLIAEALKNALPRPDFGVKGYSQNTFPSGHVAVAVSAVVALAILMPPNRWRHLLLIFASLLAALVPWASVVSFAHRPSDVMGGSLVVEIVASFVIWRGHSIAGRHRWVLIVLFCGAVCGVILVAAPSLLDPGKWTSPLTIGAGWFLLCAVPAGLVILCAPTAASAPTKNVACLRRSR
jgi:membrane-associated phospholipid phosphatase